MPNLYCICCGRLLAQTPAAMERKVRAGRLVKVGQEWACLGCFNLSPSVSVHYERLEAGGMGREARLE